MSIDLKSIQLWRANFMGVIEWNLKKLIIVILFTWMILL